MSSDFLKCLIIVDLRQLYQENRRSSVTSQQRNTGELGSYRTTENQRVWSLETPSHKRQLNCSYYLHLPYVQATESETQGIELSSSQRKAQCSQETAGISRHATSGACNFAASCESNWSAHWHIHSEVRNRLAPATTEKPVYIYSNRKAVAAAACDDTMNDVQHRVPAQCAARVCARALILRMQTSTASYIIPPDVIACHIAR